MTHKGSGVEGRCLHEPIPQSEFDLLQKQPTEKFGTVRAAKPPVPMSDGVRKQVHIDAQQSNSRTQMAPLSTN
eukprot:CAMPEP_0183439262 /NCGR_PEP_ID=MMETSP0370-20130417/77903_1 /TAXON_ID=268820 /ORGANISM="Peridinium aciculiferum, Strain PAER-2" /LENGTH=72 /DNA_ID=CAMNT_0025627675 /DNA_START=38 /DNA_END=253 /DNA_ORIENTATION=+